MRALQESGRIKLQPTFCVDDSTNLLELSKKVATMAAPEQKFVIKENFSAGKEGVTFVGFTNVDEVHNSLQVCVCYILLMSY